MGNFFSFIFGKVKRIRKKKSRSPYHSYTVDDHRELRNVQRVSARILKRNYHPTPKKIPNDKRDSLLNVYLGGSRRRRTPKEY